MYSCIQIFVFFFSSRRRHTRCLSDWSSDVCSSDLPCHTRSMTLPIAPPSTSDNAIASIVCPERIRRNQIMRTMLTTSASAMNIQRCQRSEEHTSELQSLRHLVCRLLLEKKNDNNTLTKLKSKLALPINMHGMSVFRRSYTIPPPVCTRAWIATKYHGDRRNVRQ